MAVCFYLLLERDDRAIGGVEQHTAIVNAEGRTFNLEHEIAVNVRDGE